MRASALVARKMGMAYIGKCSRVRERTGGGLGVTDKPNRGTNYLTPAERRVDELLSRSRART